MTVHRLYSRQLSLLLCALVMVACATSSTDSANAAESSSSKPRKSKAERDPLYSFTLMRQGSVLLQQGRFEDALKRFEEANRIKPGNATVHNMMGLCHLKMKAYDKALLSFDAALELTPSFTDARNNRGATYLALEQHHLAEVDFAAVLSDSTYPHRIEAFYNLGMAYLQRGEFGAAKENFNRAAYAPEPIFDAFLRLADIAREQEQPDVAIALLEEARLKFPDRIDAIIALARVLVEEGDCERARSLLDQVISARPSSDIAAEARLLREAC